MTAVDNELNQQTRDSLRVVRRKLYTIPEPELSAMSLDDQVKYGDSLHQNGLALCPIQDTSYGHVAIAVYNCSWHTAITI